MVNQQINHKISERDAITKSTPTKNYQKQYQISRKKRNSTNKKIIQIFRFFRGFLLFNCFSLRLPCFVCWPRV